MWWFLLDASPTLISSTATRTAVEAFINPALDVNAGDGIVERAAATHPSAPACSALAVKNGSALSAQLVNRWYAYFTAGDRHPRQVGLVRLRLCGAMDAGMVHDPGFPLCRPYPRLTRRA